MRVRRRRKGKEGEDVEPIRFEGSKVFTPAEVKAGDFELDLDAARYKARQGQGGDRKARRS